MNIDLDTLKDILVAFGKQIAPNMEEEDLDNAIEEYIENESDTLLAYSDPPYSEE